MEAEKINEFFSQLCGLYSGSRSVCEHSWLHRIDGKHWTIATDGRVMVCVRGEYSTEFYHQPKTFDSVLDTELSVSSVAGVADLKSFAGDMPRLTKQQCPECHGKCKIDCPRCGQEKNVKCDECDGVGTVDPFWEPETVSVFGVPVDQHYLAIALHLLDGREVVIKRAVSDPQMIRIECDGYIAMVMQRSEEPVRSFPR